MNHKKANWAFLITVLLYIGMSYVIAIFFAEMTESFFFSNLVCELAVIAPVLLFAIASKEKLPEFLGFHKVKISTLLMTALFTMLTMPLVTLVNLISQLWVENEVAAMMDAYRIGEMSFFQLLIPLAVIAPLFEEVTCRGAFYRSYQRSGSRFGAMMLSAAIFALMHMNLNQAAYAFVIGILLVMLLEASGSVWTTILYHAIVNGSQGVMMYFMTRVSPEAFSAEASAMITTDYLMYAIGVYLILAAVTLPGAWAVLVWIENREGNHGAIAELWKVRKNRTKAEVGEEAQDKKKKDKLITIPLILAIIVCFLVMSGILASAVYYVLMWLMSM